MRLDGGKLQLSATDLANHLQCKHLTHEQHRVARKERERPKPYDPLRQLLAKRGEEHESRYIELLSKGGKLSVETLGGDDPASTEQALKAGYDNIVQAPLAHDGWRGRADILRKVSAPSKLGDYSYEVIDTKLARITKGATVLQLCLYSEMLAALQGEMPELMHVVSPGREHDPEFFRVAEYQAYFNVSKHLLTDFLDGHAGPIYPEPAPLCDACSYWSECGKRRRDDDHLSLVAGMAKSHRLLLTPVGFDTVAKLGAEGAELPKLGKSGTQETLERLQSQARIQLKGRSAGPCFELLEPVPSDGLNRLPLPDAGDVFFDIEGARYVEPHGQEYLFGYVTVDGGSEEFHPIWALEAKDERRAFEAFVDMVWERWKSFPKLHVYHFGHYEPSTLKRLMQRYSSRQDEVGAMLRAGLFVDLHVITKQSVRASVERYSIKDMEPVMGFDRDVDLFKANHARHGLERVLEAGLPINDDVRELVEVTEGYNRDDCISTRRLRDWLEERRVEALDRGWTVERPLAPEQDPLREVDPEVARAQEALLKGLPDAPDDRTDEQHAKYVLAHLLEWHRRERSAGAWDYFRLKELSHDDYFMEKDALAGVEFVRSIPPEGRQKVGRHVYRFPAQEFIWNRKASLCDSEGATVGKIESFDNDTKEFTIPGNVEGKQLPPFVFQNERDPTTKALEDSLLRIAQDVVAHGLEGNNTYPAACSLLLTTTPTVPGTKPGEPLRKTDETTLDAAVRIATTMKPGFLAIQGPPGAGKTYTAAKIIDALVAKGKKVGVMAGSHQVIKNLLLKTREQGSEKISIGRKPRAGYRKQDDTTGLPVYTKAAKGLEALASGEVNVFGGTQWFWAAEEAHRAVDVLIIDEAGQLSLANAVAASQASSRLIFVGDPQQLEQPSQATHPDGTGLSVLEHAIRGHRTVPDHHGIFLEQTRRLHPKITTLTSELFYESRLSSLPGLEKQALVGTGDFHGAGLWYVPVEHDGCQNLCDEEADVVASLARSLVDGYSFRTEDWKVKPLDMEQVLVVAPYNAQVYALKDRLDGFRVGTVDKFQGQEAPVVIISMTSSSSESAPRGMEFLYSLNRLNVATSRAKAACILLASPALFEPECKTPRQIQLANGLCRYRELAVEVRWGSLGER